MKTRLASVTLALVVLCAGPAAVAAPVTVATSVLDPQFQYPSASELAPYDGAGTGRVTGRFNLVMNGTHARLEYRNYAVYLLPAVQWSYVWAFSLSRAVNQTGMRTMAFAPWTARYVRKTVTDQHGNFEFANVPPGKYVLASFVSSRIKTAHSVTTDSPNWVVDYNPPPYDMFGNEQDGPVTEVQHNYTEYHSTTWCNVAAALEAVVTVKAGDAVTDAPVQITGSHYDGACGAAR
jgi:hypothetical protein